MKIIKILCILLFITSCETNNETINLNDSKSLDSQNELRILNEEEVLKAIVDSSMEVECKGTCNDCTMIISLKTGIGQCGCNDCKLIITTKNNLGIEKQSNNDEQLMKSLMNLNFYKSSLESFNKYQEKKYNKVTDKIEKISFSANEDIITVMFEFLNPDGELKAVMYSQVIENNRISGTRYEIVCDDPCGCKEVFNFNTGTASCSCSDCKMTVTEIKEISIK